MKVSQLMILWNCNFIANTTMCRLCLNPSARKIDGSTYSERVYNGIIRKSIEHKPINKKLGRSLSNSQKMKDFIKRCQKLNQKFSHENFLSFYEHDFVVKSQLSHSIFRLEEVSDKPSSGHSKLSNSKSRMDYYVMKKLKASQEPNEEAWQEICSSNELLSFVKSVSVFGLKEASTKRIKQTV